MNLFDLLYLLLLLASAFLGAVAGSKFGGLLYGVLGAVAAVLAIFALRFFYSRLQTHFRQNDSCVLAAYQMERLCMADRRWQGSKRVQVWPSI